MTEGRGDGTIHAERATREGVELIAVVGGDGTLGEVVNGVFKATSGAAAHERPALAYLPAGTGCDFARTLGLYGLAPGEVLRAATKRAIDVGYVENLREGVPIHTRYFINIASFGASALIVEKVNHSTKIFGAQASFLSGTLRGLAAWRDQRVHVRVDDTLDQDFKVSAIAVANGRYFGGGMKVAPLALADDGQLDVVIIGSASVFRFLRYAPKLYRGEHLDVPDISFARGREIHIEHLSSGKMRVAVETDGENAGHLPARCGVIKGAIELYSPWPRAEGVG